MVSLNFLRPLPGTDIHSEMSRLDLLSKEMDLKRGSTIDSWGNRPSAPTLHLTEDELFAFRNRILRIRLRRKVFRAESIKRFFKSGDKMKLIRKVLG